MHVDAPIVAITPDGKLILRLRAWGKLGLALGDEPLTVDELLLENEVSLLPAFGIPDEVEGMQGLHHPTLLLSSNPFDIATTLTLLDGSIDHDSFLRQGVQEATAASLNAVFGRGAFDRLTNSFPIAGIATDPRATGDCVVVPEGIVIVINLPGTQGVPFPQRRTISSPKSKSRRHCRLAK